MNPLPGRDDLPPGTTLGMVSGKDDLAPDYPETVAARRAEEERWRHEDRRFWESWWGRFEWPHDEE